MDFLKTEYQHELSSNFCLLWKQCLGSKMLGAQQLSQYTEILTGEIAKFWGSLVDVYGNLHPESMDQSIRETKRTSWKEKVKENKIYV